MFIIYCCLVSALSGVKTAFSANLVCGCPFLLPVRLARKEECMTDVCFLSTH